MPVTPSSSARYFTRLYGEQHGAPSFGYLWDDTVLWLDTNGLLHTGAMRPITPADFATITLSGVSFTGEFNTQAEVNITGQTIPVHVTGNVNSGVFTSTTSIITGSQLVVASGFKSASVAIISGYAYVNGVGPIGNGISMTYGGGYGGGYISAAPLVVGTTGSASVPSQVLVISEF